MKIFFTTPYEGKKLYQKYIDRIIDDLESNGHEVVSFKKTTQKQKAYSQENVRREGSLEKAHYNFIRQGIASADAVVIESTYDSFRVGHEATLAIIYQKPLLVLAQDRDLGKLIPHENFTGAQYTNENLEKIISAFLDSVENQARAGSQESVSPLQDNFDIRHSINLSTLRRQAQMGTDYVADWARRTTTDPESVYKEILEKLGDLPIQKPWDVFAKIYDEDTPDYVAGGPVEFSDRIFRKFGIHRDDLIVDVGCGTGTISRLLRNLRYKNLLAFDNSRPMLGEAFRLCADIPTIKIIEADIASVKLQKLVKGMVWHGYSSNYAMTEKEMNQWLSSLASNLSKGGVLIFDIRTKTGWNVDFYKQKVAIFETKNFQRISINLPDYPAGAIRFDIFIRTKNDNGEWNPWGREQMIERMWDIDKLQEVVEQVKSLKLVGLYGDDFDILKPTEPEPNLAYFVLQKR